MKPDDVTAEAWDAADITFDLETYGDGGLYHRDAQIKIARAITAAVAAEREACAERVLSYAGESGEQNDPPEIRHLSAIVRAIRAGSNP